MATSKSELPISLEQLSSLSRSTKLEVLELLQERERRTARRKILNYYPDSGPLRRELYPKHIQFFNAGSTSKIRLAMCANRVGKTEGMGCCETTYHLTGQYPDWWKGYRFVRPIVSWVSGETAKDVRDSLQRKLLGPPGAHGTGAVPGDLIKRTTARSGVPDAIDTFYVQHVSGGLSSCTFKAYEQGRESFQAADVDWMWFDEEPPLSIFTEGLTRTMTNRGRVILTFTPLLGMSETVLHLLPGGNIEERSSESVTVILCNWEDVPHLDEKEKAILLASYPPFQRDARSKGIPQLGAGAIYPVPESDLLVDPFPIPDYWPQGYGMDVGWNCTAAVWGAHDRERDILYLVHEHRRSQAEPSVNAHGIRAAGEWIPGFIDPASRSRSQKDGSQLLYDYIDLGLKLSPADNGVESGLYAVWNRMSTGRLKVFRNLGNWLEEFRLYRRDEKGHVVKKLDHLMDAMRYLESRISSMETQNVKLPHPENAIVSMWERVSGDGQWMG